MTDSPIELSWSLFWFYSVMLFICGFLFGLWVMGLRL